MVATTWPTSNWPEGVSHDVTDYEKPLFSILDDSARDYPNEVYTIFNDATRTYAQVKDTADRIANFLVSRGIQKGDRVAIFLPNIPHYPALFFGILKAGAVCVTCNPLYTANELNYQLNDAGAKAVFCMDHPIFYPTTAEAIKDTGVETVVVCSANDNSSSSLCAPATRVIALTCRSAPSARSIAAAVRPLKISTLAEVAAEGPAPTSHNASAAIRHSCRGPISTSLRVRRTDEPARAVRRWRR